MTSGPPSRYRPRHVRLQPPRTNGGDDAPASVFDAHLHVIDPRFSLTPSQGYVPEPFTVERYRAAVAGEAGEELDAVVRDLAKARYEIGGEALKTVPRGFDRDHPRAKLLRHKGVTIAKAFPPAKWLHTKAALERVRKVWADAGPLNAWLDRHVGPSTLPPDR